MNLALTLLAALTSQPWLGETAPQAYLHDTLTRVAQLEGTPDALRQHLIQLRGSAFASDPFALPPMYAVADGVGIVKINGPLVSGSAGFMRLFGLTGYDDVRQAVNELVSQKNVKSIILHVGSPGGLATGCGDCASHIKAAAKIKPIITFSDSGMTSAAYWLGSSASKILAGPTSVLGSVGVLITAVSVKRANDQAGVDKKVIRIGEHKAPYTPDEEIGEAAIKHLTAQGEEIYSVFRAAIAENLGMDEATFDRTVGRGREFMGAKAVEAGLAHKLATFDEAIAFAKNIDTGSYTRQNSGNSKGTSMKLTLAASIIAQLCAGVDPLKLNLSVPAANAEGQAPDAEAVTALTSQAIVMSATLKEGTATAVKAVVDPLQADLNKLKTDLSVANTELVGLKATNTELVTAATANKGLIEKAEATLAASAAAMAVALGVTAPAEGLKGVELVAAHDKLEADFKAKFPNRKVTVALSAEEPAQKPAAGAEVPLFARLALAQG